MKLALLLLSFLVLSISSYADEIDDLIQENAQSSGPVLDPDAILEGNGRPHQINLDMQVPPEHAEEVNKIVGNLEKNPLLKMLSPQQRKAAAMMMKKNPFQEMKRDMIKNTILTKMSPTSPVGRFLRNNPKYADMGAEWVVDKEAIPAFISIINQPAKMKKFGIIAIIVFISIFVYNLKNSKQDIFKRLMTKVLLIFLSAGINLGAFYFIFKKELAPTIDIIMKYL